MAIIQHHNGGTKGETVTIQHFWSYTKTVETNLDCASQQRTYLKQNNPLQGHCVSADTELQVVAPCEKTWMLKWNSSISQPFLKCAVADFTHQT